ncbi:MAG: hypothetical protein MN733_33720, partial [Nitrososphaera sp.]|nr:hypothetical protein [Nitrososphaera sp.]
TNDQPSSPAETGWGSGPGAGYAAEHSEPGERASSRMSAAKIIIFTFGFPCTTLRIMKST